MNQPLCTTRRRAGVDIDPAVLLERTGIEHFSVDRDRRTVFLWEAGFETMAARLGMRLFSGAKAFRRAGWIWKIEGGS